MRFLRMTCGNAALRAGGAASSVFVGVWVCVRAHGRVHMCVMCVCLCVCVSMHVCVATKSKQTAKVPAKWLAAYDVGGK
jgi:hypothetical protein